MGKVLLGYIIGVSFAFFLYYRDFENEVKTKTVKSIYKPIIDYRLKGNNKQIDTIWIYKFKKH